MENLMEWISVKDRLPEEGELVLTITIARPDFPEYRLDYTIIVTHSDNPYFWACRLTDECNTVTHWMPLPEPPKDI